MQRPLPLRKVDGAFHLEGEPVVERCQELRRGEKHEPSGDELDRERQAVEPPADRLHGEERLVAERHPLRGG